MPARELPDKFLVAFSFAGEQRDFVRAIAEAVEEKLGRSNVFLDEWFDFYLAGSDADVKLQEIYDEKCELAVACISEEYGTTVWPLDEHSTIRARIRNARVSGDELGVLPIRVGDGDVRGIPDTTFIRDCRNLSPGEVASLIVNRLHLILPDLDAGAADKLDWPDQQPELDWPVVDHNEVRDAFKKLVTRTVPWRFLPVCGPSESGKSYITRQMLGNALRLPDLACGRFDFKGTTDMDAELKQFVEHLGIPLPPDSSRLNARLNHILDVLKKRAQPALLIFDTYEFAGEAEEWVQGDLLRAVIRSTWLRVVIAGQRMPGPAGAMWEPNAHPVITLKPPPPTDWFAYGKRHHPDLKMKQVEAACKLARGRSALLAQLLGPTP